MANAAIAHLNLADDGRIISFSSQTTAMPTTNVLVPHVARRWRSSASSAFFIIDLLSAQSIDTIGVFGMTMGDSGSIRIRASATDATAVAADVYDSGLMTVDTAYNSQISLMTSPGNARYIRVDLDDIDATYVEAGRIFVGLRHLFTINFSYGWERSWTDRSVRNRTRGGQTQVFLDNMFRTIDATFGFLTKTERDSFIEDIDRLNAMNTDVLYVGDVASTNLARDSIWGLMADISPVVQQYFNRFIKKYKIEERL